MNLILHNTLTGKKESFAPLKAGQVGLYVCGITPYDEAHIGHARCYVAFDVLKRVLQWQGYKVTHIQNFTDVDDKIINRANEKKADPKTYAEPFIKSFQDSMKALNVLPADQYPRVTTHMKEIVDLIQKLVQRGLAYELEGDVYFAVRKFSGYGQLSKRKLDELESGARVEVDERKKDALDFALWKKAKAGEPSWPSPWSPGRPGWHIECSAMSMKYLGEEFDIHGGGLDLIFPHHENELAQSVGATGQAFARTWLHNGFVTINQEKMSKSLGNFFTLKDVLAKFEPMVVRYYLLSQHYKGPLNFSDKELEAAKRAWEDRICGAYAAARRGESPTNNTMVLAEDGAKEEFTRLLEDFKTGLLQDLNTAMALAALNEYCSHIFSVEKAFGANLAAAEWGWIKTGLDTMLGVLGLVAARSDNWDPKILDLVEQREQARKSKDWAGSDRIRQELQSLGVVVEDTPNGPRLKKV